MAEAAGASGPRPYPRVIGRRHGASAGPTLIVVGGVHGNEPAGVRGAERALARLDAAGVTLRGDLVALTGNTRALAAGRRFQARDLNRQWSTEALARVAVAADDDPEIAEVRELRAELDAAVAAARGAVYFLDFHTTSADGVPFSLIGDTLAQRRFAAAFMVPVILGLEEQLDGVLSEYMAARGAITVAVEGGQHQSPAAAEHLEAVLWVALVAAGLLERSALPGVAEAEAQLSRARGSLPTLLEVLGRHAVLPDDDFRMQPGYANIGRVRAGELLARDKRGDIRASRDGMLLLPLYQSQGEDGFFTGREIGDLEQRAARLARRLRLDRLALALPGVRRAPAGDANERIRVGATAAAMVPLALFRWFGFRRVVDGAGESGLTLQRRIRGG